MHCKLERSPADACLAALAEQDGLAAKFDKSLIYIQVECMFFSDHLSSHQQ
jgi:hypothetical protein